MKLWKYNKITGYWEYLRDVTAETAKQWLEIFKKDDPTAFFQLSKRKPTKF